MCRKKLFKNLKKYSHYNNIIYLFLYVNLNLRFFFTYTYTIFMKMIRIEKNFFDENVEFV